MSTRSLPPSPAASLAAWWRRLLGRAAVGDRQLVDLAHIEQPWRSRWDHLPRRSAGPGFGVDQRREAHQRAREVARTTLGDSLWYCAQQQGYLDLPSQQHRGITYRLRVGRRIEVLCAPGINSPWPCPYLCINPTYPLPEEEFFAQLYLYVRDREDVILRVAAPQPWDQTLGRTF